MHYDSPEHQVKGIFLTPWAAIAMGLIFNLSSLCAGTWNVETFAGKGTAGSANSENGLDAEFKTPTAITTDGTNVYVSDMGNSLIRLITPAGAASTTGIVSTYASCYNPWGLCFDQSDNLYVCDQAESKIIEIASGGATSATFVSGLNAPSSIAMDSSGNFYVADSNNYRILKITPGGTQSIFAGTGASGTPTPGPSTSSAFNYIYGLAFDSSDNLFVADYLSRVICKITPGGTLSTFASSFNGPIGLAFNSLGNLFVADQPNNVICMITPGGAVSTIAGTGTAGSTNGTGAIATFNRPYGLAFDSSDNLFVADYGNNKIRKLTFVLPTPNITWATPTAITYGTALSSTQLDATASATVGGSTVTPPVYDLLFT